MQPSAVNRFSTVRCFTASNLFYPGIIFEQFSNPMEAKHGLGTCYKWAQLPSWSCRLSSCLSQDKTKSTFNSNPCSGKSILISPNQIKKWMLSLIGDLTLKLSSYIPFCCLPPASVLQMLHLSKEYSLPIFTRAVASQGLTSLALSSAGINGLFPNFLF